MFRVHRGFTETFLHIANLSFSTQFKNSIDHFWIDLEIMLRSITASRITGHLANDLSNFEIAKLNEKPENYASLVRIVLNY